MVFRCSLASSGLLAGLMLSTTAMSATFTTLYSFPATNNAARGMAPVGAIQYRHGFLYGVAGLGGTDEQSGGTLFKLNTKTLEETTLYKFQDTQDAYRPQIGLIVYNGLFYGATAYGISACGAVYSLNPADDSVAVVHSFPKCGYAISSPWGLTQAGGLLYGISRTGGKELAGTIFTVDPASGDTTELYQFKGDTKGQTDGSNPEGAPLVVDGILYGTTEFGGTGYSGSIFSFDVATGIEKTLYSFPDTANHSFPGGNMIYYKGSLYGVASGSGHSPDGEIYRYNIATKSKTVLHDFMGDKEGSEPAAGLTLIGTRLYGSTTKAGAGGGGTIFSVDVVTGKFRVLHSFTGTEGSNSLTPLLYQKGVFFGATAAGGTSGNGTIFSFAP